MTIATISHPSHPARPVPSLADRIVAAMPELRRKVSPKQCSASSGWPHPTK